jgi:kynurenine formamidase
MKVNGTENAGGFFTRGVLIDIAALKGVKILPKGYAITLADYQEALKKQGVGDATKGDVILFRTGWNALWKTNHLGRPAGRSRATSKWQKTAQNSPRVSLASRRRSANTWRRRRFP